MSRPDSSAIDAAVVKWLRDDPALQALTPDGVYIDEAPADAKRYVIVQLADGRDVPTFDDDRAIEETTYVVKAVMRAGANIDPASAAARIDALLDGTEFPVPGYRLIDVYRDPEAPRVRYTEKDPNVPELRYFHRGGQYRVQVAAATE